MLRNVILKLLEPDHLRKTFLWLHLATISAISLEIFNKQTFFHRCELQKQEKNALHSAVLISMGKWTGTVL